MNNTKNIQSKYVAFIPVGAAIIIFCTLFRDLWFEIVETQGILLLSIMYTFENKLCSPNSWLVRRIVIILLKVMTPMCLFLYIKDEYSYKYLIDFFDGVLKIKIYIIIILITIIHRMPSPLISKIYAPKSPIRVVLTFVGECIFVKNFMIRMCTIYILFPEDYNQIAIHLLMSECIPAELISTLDQFIFRELENLELIAFCYFKYAIYVTTSILFMRVCVDSNWKMLFFTENGPMSTFSLFFDNFFFAVSMAYLIGFRIIQIPLQSP
ncbi:unnamed protein product [Moneuplotes crassus]|uniref:Uncharacterized protein n=1 Tax=Euplotes crassus TaxID=5936 RepID=A0AAD1XTL5_EUPCR|nr:unnamed protein product [Moneuplotes crassus]